MVNKGNLLTIVLLAIIGIMAFFHVWGSNPLITDEYQIRVDSLLLEITLKDSLISDIILIRDSLDKQVLLYEGIDTTLINNSNSIKIIYREVYNSIPTATTVELDSIIRANW